ncbi:MAG: type II toxin-antitoxin system RelE/ParE family toxin [Gammaproteobacteria bacterium]|nr:type II toxin-antitoxin system RelE/ParE family toxin [Gammaproteobacteria bacterium]MBU1724746.1 type II toxin-antitoxin system RelE/ParE family toxin [Gammaproteobacteria bacterium]MBU2005917.1 type II toxin-antitoxin system RelE/ParE family toxin [Gammaproteobacteria bacterium]
MKKAVFRGNSLNDIRTFPEPAKKDAGYAIDDLQHGRMPSDFKSMPDVGSGVYEIRISTPPSKEQYRVFYIAKFEDAIYILHAFHKKTQKTAQRDLEAGRKQYKTLIEELKP